MMPKSLGALTNMNRMLSNELKIGGFPNIGNVEHREGREYITADYEPRVYHIGDEAYAGNWFVPTLSELIEACGDKFSSLHKHSFGWLATSTSAYADAGHGDNSRTPEEAVARLWLALNPSVSLQAAPGSRDAAASSVKAWKT
jgi:hypothetical protein